MLNNIFENLNAESTTAEKTMHSRHVHRSKTQGHVNSEHKRS